MAVFPEGNPGEFPVILTSKVGQFRALAGDLNSTPYSPVYPGFQNFVKFSDSEIEGYLAQGGDSVARAIGYSYLYLASQAAMESKAIKDYDLQLDKTKRAADLMAVAKMWFGQADGEEVIAGEEAFEIVPTGTRSRAFIPEVTVPIWGRQYTWAPWRR
jgi:hypothetical protein